ncbi:MAG: cation transporter [Planctomycetaceae bacterium]|nr:cation transporter [Planctomycetaceae bacterium]
MDEPHSHRHYHHGPPINVNRAFALGVGLNVAFAGIEATCGLWSGSMALLADAGHNVSDVLGLLLAWAAAYISGFSPNLRRTYGLRRSTILAGLANGLVLFVATGGIAWEAIRRFAHPEPVAGGTVLVVALIGVVVNTGTALLFLSGRKDDLNIRGAFLHMLADAAVSLAVALGGFVILKTGWVWVDPLLSLVVVAVILAGSFGLLRDATNLALDAVPEGIDSEAVLSYLRSLPGIDDVHDLHIWGVSTTETALTVHLVKPDGAIDDGLLARIHHDLERRFHIVHSTIQLESSGDDHACGLVKTEQRK